MNFEVERNIFGLSGQIPEAGSACLITGLDGVAMLVSRLEEVSWVTMVGVWAQAARNKSETTAAHFAAPNFARLIFFNALAIIRYLQP